MKKTYKHEIEKLIEKTQCDIKFYKRVFEDKKVKDLNSWAYGKWYGKLEYAENLLVQLERMIEPSSSKISL